LVSAAAIAAAPAASGAETPSVLLTKEEGRATAVRGEPANVFIEFFLGPGFGCEGVDEAATVSRNPWSPLRINGSNTDESSKACFRLRNKAETEPASGALFDKRVVITTAGEIRVSLIATLEESAGCVWEVRSLTGTQEFPGFTFAVLKGTAHAQKPPEGVTGCVVKTRGVYAEVDVYDATGETYGVSLFG
jgi:hypothetical protein